LAPLWRRWKRWKSPKEERSPPRTRRLRLHDRCICCIRRVELSKLWLAVGAFVVSLVVLLLFQSLGVVRFTYIISYPKYMH
jgi:hypothetical protein